MATFIREVTADDVHKVGASIQYEGKTYWLREALGRVMPQDVGKRLYLSDARDGQRRVLQVENDRQINERVAGLMLTSIGDVVVHRGYPPDGNPYRSPGLSGESRREALRRFRAGEDTSYWTFWHAPAGGGARTLLGPEEVRWA